MACTLEITYDGGDVADGEMDVRELAPALLAYADLLQIANERLNDDQARAPRIAIQGAPRQGSFILQLVVQDPGLLKKALTLLTGETTAAILNAKDLVAAVAGAIRVISLGARNAPRSEPDRNGDITINGNAGTIIVNQYAAPLLDNPRFVKQARGVVRPVNGVTADTLQVRSDAFEPILVTAEQSDRFYEDGETPYPIEQHFDSDATLYPIRTTFTPGHKWRMLNGEVVNNYSIDDEAFEKRVTSGGVAIKASDRFRCRIRVTHTQLDEATTRTTHSILRVLEHIEGDIQGDIREELADNETI